jgi:hypothetical protein
MSNIGQLQVKYVQSLEDRLRICEQNKNEFLEQRDSARQLAYTLSEYAKAVHEGKQVAYPAETVAQMDLARGIAGRYQWPEGERKIE